MAKFVRINVARHVAIEILRFLKAFAFSEMSGVMLTQGAGVTIPKPVADALAGISTPANDKLAEFLHHVAANESEVSEKVFYQKAREANIDLEDAKALYNGTWSKAQELMDDDGVIDAAGLAKKLDCSENEAKFLLGFRKNSGYFTTGFVLNDQFNIVGLAITGLATFYFGPVPLTNAFLSRLATAAGAQVVARVTEFTIHKGLENWSIWSAKDNNEGYEPVPQHHATHPTANAGGGRIDDDSSQLGVGVNSNYP